MTKVNDDINLLQVFGTLRRNLLPILGATLLVGAATYAVSRAQPQVYESRGSIISLFSNVGNQVVNNTLVTAPPLPQGALEEALLSRAVIDNIMTSVEHAKVGSEQTEAIRTSLQGSLATGKTSMISVNSRLDAQQRGVYEIIAHAGTPGAARVLAGATVQALLNWDGNRAQTGVTRARKSIEAQLQALDDRLKVIPAGSPDNLSLTAARGLILQNLSQVAVLEQTSSGTLAPGADPSEPVAPIAPRPTRNAALAALLTLFAGSGLALLLSSLRGRINTTADLMPLGLPMLGQVPLMNRRELAQGILRASRSGRLYDALGFLRINLLSVAGDPVRVVAITSSRPGAGKSSIAATLAASFAEEGRKVLLIDADLHRPTQHHIWNMGSTQLVALPGTSEEAERGRTQATLPFALQRPEMAYAAHDPAQPNIDLLPAGQTGRQSYQSLNRPDLSELLHRWASGYDLVIIDTPPILALADTLKLTMSTDGVIVVVEAGETSLSELERVQQIAQQNGVKLLGAVLNKISRSEQSYYYGYNYGELANK